jgi:chemotaxis family two-component system sensor kinase Cph1
LNEKQNRLDALRSVAETHLAHFPQTQTREQHIEKLLHELQVCQIELEIQNEELLRSQLGLEQSRDRYADLYDFSPVGYLSLSREGSIIEINLTGTKFLGVDRNKLLGRRFVSFIAPEDSDRWHLHLLSVLGQDGQQSCELAIKRGDGSVFHARLDCLKTNYTNEFSIRIALADLT